MHTWTVSRNSLQSSQLTTSNADVPIAWCGAWLWQTRDSEKSTLSSTCAHSFNNMYSPESYSWGLQQANICRNALKAEPSQMQELIVQPRESLRTCVKQQLQRAETCPHNLQKSISGDWVKQRSADTRSQLNHCKSWNLVHRPDIHLCRLCQAIVCRHAIAEDCTESWDMMYSQLVTGLALHNLF